MDNDGFFAKMRAGVLDLWLDECFGPKWPITGFLGLDPKVKGFFDPFSANPTKWSNILKQFVYNLLMNCLSVFDHFLKLVLKGLRFENFIGFNL